MDDVRLAAPPRWAAAGALALALPVTPLAVAAFGEGSAAPAILAGGAAGLVGLAAWLGPTAWPGIARALAVERVMVTAVIAYAMGSVWSMRAPGEVWWRWPVACTLTAAAWILGQAVA